MTISENHNIHTRQSNNLHLPQDNLTIYQQGIHYSGTKRFNNLPLEMGGGRESQEIQINLSKL